MRRFVFVIVAFSVFSLPAPPARAGFGRDAYHPVVVAPIGFNTLFNSAAPDGNGGMFVAWTGPSVSAGDVLVQHLDALGAIAPGWPAAGIPVCGALGTQSNGAILADG